MNTDNLATTFGSATFGYYVRNVPTLRSRRFLVYSIFWTLQYILLFAVVYVWGGGAIMDWMSPRVGCCGPRANPAMSIAVSLCIYVSIVLLPVFLLQSRMRKLRGIIENDLGLPGPHVESYTYPQVEQRFFLSIITNLLLAATAFFVIVGRAVISLDQSRVSLSLLTQILIGMAVVAVITALYYWLGRCFLEICRTKQNFLAAPPLVDNPFEVILAKKGVELEASHREAIARFDPEIMTEDEPVEAKPFPRHWVRILGLYALASIALFCWAALEPNAPRKMFEQIGIYHYTELTDFVPWSASKYYRRGMREQGNPQKALEYFTTAIRLNPNFADAYHWRSHRWQDVRLVGDTGGITLIDGKVVYVQMPAEELRRRNLELALADMNEVIRLRPRASYYYYVRGRLYEQLGEPEKAAADFERSGMRRAR